MNRPSGAVRGFRVTMTGRRGGQKRWWYLVPIGGFIAVAGLAFTLIGVVMLRPWAGPDSSWRTHMNLTEDPYAGYTRSVQSLVSPEGSAPILVWQPDACRQDTRSPGVVEASGGNAVAGSPSCARDGRVLFVARGCASCHGVDGRGATVAPPVLGATERTIRRVLNGGPGGMPAFSETDLPEPERDLLVAYILSLGPAPTPTPAPPAATPTPGPAPTATPAPAATPTAEPGTTPVAPATGGATPQPSPQPASTPTAEPAPTATATPAPAANPADIERGRLLYLDVGCDMCHGARAEGTDRGPALKGLDAEGIRRQVRDPARPPDSAFPRKMQPYALADLSDEELELIIQFLHSLD